MNSSLEGVPFDLEADEPPRRTGPRLGRERLPADEVRLVELHRPPEVELVGRGGLAVDQRPVRGHVVHVEQHQPRFDARHVEREDAGGRDAVRRAGIDRARPTARAPAKHRARSRSRGRRCTRCARSRPGCRGASPRPRGSTSSRRDRDRRAAGGSPARSGPAARAPRWRRTRLRSSPRTGARCPAANAGWARRRSGGTSSRRAARSCRRPAPCRDRRTRACTAPGRSAHGPRRASPRGRASAPRRGRARGTCRAARRRRAPPRCGSRGTRARARARTSSRRRSRPSGARRGSGTARRCASERVCA